MFGVPSVVFLDSFLGVEQPLNHSAKIAINRFSELVIGFASGLRGASFKDGKLFVKTFVIVLGYFAFQTDDLAICLPATP
jgi:hypothetical protein